MSLYHLSLPLQFLLQLPSAQTCENVSEDSTLLRDLLPTLLILYLSPSSRTVSTFPGSVGCYMLQRLFTNTLHCKPFYKIFHLLSSPFFAINMASSVSTTRQFCKTNGGYQSLVPDNHSFFCIQCNNVTNFYISMFVLIENFE